MPAYDYTCKKCGYEFVEIHPMHKTVKECPSCGGELERGIGGGLGFTIQGGASPGRSGRMERWKDEQARIGREQKGKR